MIIPREASNVMSKNMESSTNLSVRQEDIQHIIHLLSTNLYSQPIESLVREIVSNAVDATIEAGNDNPVLVKISESGEFSVTDFGTGISPKRFEELYTNFGASSKRDSNDFIGSFGIGRLSPLSYTDFVTIITVYNGVKYEYALIKDGLKISFNTISEEPTEELDGTCVKLQIKKDDLTSKKFQNAIIDQLFFFENIVVVDESKNTYYNSDASEVFKNRIIKDFTHFKMGTSTVYNVNTKGVKLLLGNVLYPLKEVYVSQLSEDLGRNRYSDGIFTLKFPIGELNVTPNREEIIYSASTIKKVEEKIEAAIKEFKEIKKLHNLTPIELAKIPKFFTTARKLFPLYKTDLIDYFQFALQKDDFFTIKVKDKTYQFTLQACDKVFEAVRKVFRYNAPIEGVKISYSSIGESLRSSVYFKDTTEIFEKICKKKFYVEDLKTLKPKTKEYLREKVVYPTVFSANTLKAFRILGKRAFKDLMPLNSFTDHLKQEVKEIFRFLNDVVFDKDDYTIIDDSIVPETYSRPARASYQRVKKEKVNPDIVRTIPSRVYGFDDYGRVVRRREEISLDKSSDIRFIYLNSEIDPNDSPTIIEMIRRTLRINSRFSKKLVLGIISQASERILKALDLPNVYSFDEFFTQDEEIKTWVKDLHYVSTNNILNQFSLYNYGYRPLTRSISIIEIYEKYFSDIREYLELSNTYLESLIDFVKYYKQFSYAEETWDEPSEGLKALIEAPERTLFQQYFEFFNSGNSIDYEACILLEKCLNLDVEKLLEIATEYKKQKQNKNETN